MKFYEAIIYVWPFSQNCLDCHFGQEIMIECEDEHQVICSEGCKENDGKFCPKKKLRGEI